MEGLQLIPKVIHYCWFGGNQLSEKALQCIESWKKYCPDYEIIEWNETNFDVNCNQYVREAYNNKKWAFVSDYARLSIIYNEGGFYFDTDVELLKPIEELRGSKAFFAQEIGGMVASGLGFGAEKGNFVVKLMMDEYENEKFILRNGELDLLPCPIRNTKVLFDLGYINNGQTQTIMGAKIFAAEYFCPYDYIKKRTKVTSNTFSVHYYEGSWDYPQEIKDKYKIFYTLFGHHIGHFICETGEKIRNEGLAAAIRFARYRVKNKIQKMRLSNRKSRYGKGYCGTD